MGLILLTLPEGPKGRNIDVLVPLLPGTVPLGFESKLVQAYQPFVVAPVGRHGNHIEANRPYCIVIVGTQVTEETLNKLRVTQKILIGDNHIVTFQDVSLELLAEFRRALGALVLHHGSDKISLWNVAALLDVSWIDLSKKVGVVRF